MDYTIHTDVKFGPLEVIDTDKLAGECTEKWWNQSLVQVNDCVVRLGVFHGEFHWHKHDNEDELFFVLEGKLLLDLKESTIELTPHQGFMVPKGFVHRTRATERTVVLMVEAGSVAPRGD